MLNRLMQIVRWLAAAFWLSADDLNRAGIHIDYGPK